MSAYSHVDSFNASRVLTEAGALSAEKEKLFLISISGLASIVGPKVLLEQEENTPASQKGGSPYE
jgi:hypothetical protein